MDMLILCHFRVPGGTGGSRGAIRAAALPRKGKNSPVCPPPQTESLLVLETVTRRRRPPILVGALDGDVSFLLPAF